MIKGYIGIPKNVVGITQLRRNPQKVFEIAERESAPVLVVESNTPKGILLSMDSFEDLTRIKYQFEQEDALNSFKVYEEEKSAGKLKRLTSLKDLCEK